jgi:hypothetical protein
VNQDARYFKKNAGRINITPLAASGGDCLLDGVGEEGAFKATSKAVTHARQAGEEFIAIGDLFFQLFTTEIECN